MSASPSDRLSALDALSPVDGRYRAATASLRGLLSEGGLIRERIRVEAHWLLHLSAAVPQLPQNIATSTIVRSVDHGELLRTERSTASVGGLRGTESTPGMAGTAGNPAAF